MAVVWMQTSQCFLASKAMSRLLTILSDSERGIVADKGGMEMDSFRDGIHKQIDYNVRIEERRDTKALPKSWVDV